MEYYSAIRNNEFMKFLGKWMELENTILSEVTRSQKINHGMHTLILETETYVLKMIIMYMLHYVHSSPIYNSQKLERTQVSLSRRMDAKKCGIYTQWSTIQPLATMNS